MELVPYSEPIDPATAAVLSPSERGGRTSDPSTTSRAIAALAFGLAYSPLAPEHAVAEIVGAGDHQLLVRARRDLIRQLPEHPPAITGRARALLDAAIRTADPRPRPAAAVDDTPQGGVRTTKPTLPLVARFG